jgi:hypothetical protein
MPMSDEQVDSATTETTETRTASEVTSAETETTEQTSTQGPIPYDRFKEVNDKYKTAREEAEALAREKEDIQRKYDEAVASKRTEVDTGAGQETELPTPPAGLSERQAVDWYVREGAERMLKERLGMSLDDLATLVKSVPQAANYAQERQWEALCTKHGLDPNSRDVQEVAQGLLYSAGDKADPDKVVGRVAEMLGVKKPSSTEQPPSPSRVETDGVGSQLTAEDFMPRNKTEAHKAAAAGKRMPFLSTDEILKRTKQQRAKGG